MPTRCGPIRPKTSRRTRTGRMILEYIRRFPDNILTRDNAIAHMTSSGFVVNADASKVLMAHHNLYRVWAWTGRPCRRGSRPAGGGPAGGAGGDRRGACPAPVRTDRLGGYPARLGPREGGAVCMRPPASERLLSSGGRETDPLRAREGENTRVGWLPAEHLLEYTREWQMDGVYTKLLARARALLGRETGRA